MFILYDIRPAIEKNKTKQGRMGVTGNEGAFTFCRGPKGTMEQKPLIEGRKFPCYCVASAL